MRNFNVFYSAILITALFASTCSWANGSFYSNLQSTVKGIVIDDNGEPLIGINVIEKGTSNGTVTDLDGKFEINIERQTYLDFSAMGFESKSIKVNPGDDIKVTLEDASQKLNEIVMVGSRNPDRTVTDSPVPVDIIAPSSLPTQVGKVQVTDMLQYAAPSFNATKQSGSDGSDHIVPATLRGLGPDQVLVLINGKRRHQSSLINLFGTRGRGNTGTDLNAIPQISIKRIEVLRDGAAAQYGSDAIAGVINIVTKDGDDKPEAYVNFGGYNANTPGDFPEGNPNTGDNYLDPSGIGNATKKRPAIDGLSTLVAFNYGKKIAKKGGFFNISGQYTNVEMALRPSFDFRRGFGTPAVEGFSFFGNMEIPITKKMKFYAFGGSNLKDGNSFAFSRNVGDARNVASIYPNGFTPRITARITDNSVSAGIKLDTDSGWHIDLSNTYGKNYFHYDIENTLNASLESNSPTSFDAGGHSLSMNVTNLDFSKKFDLLNGFNLAFGSVYRVEGFEIFAGEEGSYEIYDINQKPVTSDSQTIPTIVTGKDDDGNDIIEPRAAGSQGFPGYSPSNVIDKSRNNLAFYLDTELDINKRILVGGAARFERYSDFGNTFNGKLSARIKLTDGINFRASASTGFRAPSLAQLYYNLKFSNVNATGIIPTLLSSNDSPITRGFGIGKLKQETSLSGTAGLTAKLGIFSASLDAYWIRVNNRILLTGYFPSSDIPQDVLDELPPSLKKVEEVQFFVNGTDTRSIGLDIVVSAKKEVGNGGIATANLIGNINNMKILNIHNGKLDEKNFFGRRPQSFLLASAPNSKFTVNLGYKKKWFNLGLTFTRFGKIDLIDYQALEGDFDGDYDKATDYYEPKIVSDIAIGFDIMKGTKLSFGSNNIFNVYPSTQDDWSEQGGYWDSVQMGFSGAYYFARLNYSF